MPVASIIKSYDLLIQMRVIHLVKYITKNGPIVTPYGSIILESSISTTYEKRQHRLGPQTCITQTRPHHQSNILCTNGPEQGVQVAGCARATLFAMRPFVRGDLEWRSYSLEIRVQGAFFVFDWYEIITRLQTKFARRSQPQRAQRRRKEL